MVVTSLICMVASATREPTRRPVLPSTSQLFVRGNSIDAIVEEEGEKSDLEAYPYVEVPGRFNKSLRDIISRCVLVHLSRKERRWQRWNLEVKGRRRLYISRDFVVEQAGRDYIVLDTTDRGSLEDITYEITRGRPPLQRHGPDLSGEDLNLELVIDGHRAIDWQDESLRAAQGAITVGPGLKEFSQHSYHP